MNYYLLTAILVLLLALALGYWLFFVRVSYDAGEVILGGDKFQVEIAKNLKQQMQGLSGKESLREREGMVFIYSKQTIPSFWMKDMNFPIDIIWVRDKKIIGLVEGAEPAGYKRGEIFRPASEIDLVIEVNSGIVKKLGLQINDSIKF